MKRTHNPRTEMALKSRLWSLLNREFKREKKKKKDLFPPPCPRDETSLDSSGQFGLISAVWSLWWG